MRKSSFYRPYLTQNPHVSDFPIIDKSIFMSHFNEINTVNIDLHTAMGLASQAEEDRDFSPTLSGITVGLSSGTSGNKGVFLASEKERAYWVALILDRVIGFSFKKRRVAFFLRANSNIYNSVHSKLLYFQFFDLLKPLEGHIKILNDLQPTFLVGQPSLLIELAKAIEQKRLIIKPEKVISVAEVLSPEDNIYLSKVFNQIIHQVYQCTEGLLASTCENGTLHFHEDYLCIEKKYIDEKTGRFHPIITDFKRKSQLIVRYELNDIIIAKESCACGSRMLAIEAIEGRSDDILVFRNIRDEDVTVFPDFLRRAIIMSSSEIYDYVLIQSEKNHLFLYIDTHNSAVYNKAREAIQHLLNQFDIDNIIINRISNNPHLQGNKLRRIRNDIRKTH